MTMFGRSVATFVAPIVLSLLASVASAQMGGGSLGQIDTFEMRVNGVIGSEYDVGDTIKITFSASGENTLTEAKYFRLWAKIVKGSDSTVVAQYKADVLIDPDEPFTFSEYSIYHTIPQSSTEVDYIASVTLTYLDTVDPDSGEIYIDAESAVFEKNE